MIYSLGFQFSSGKEKQTFLEMAQGFYKKIK